MSHLWLFIIALNLASFFLFGFDKRRARKGKRRVSEKTLWLLALPIGSLGALMGMWSFQHKTRKFPFMIGMPILFAVHVGLAFRYLL